MKTKGFLLLAFLFGLFLNAKAADNVNGNGWRKNENKRILIAGILIRSVFEC